MKNNPSRRGVLAGATSLAASAALPALPVVAPDDWWLRADEVGFAEAFRDGIDVEGCGDACDCCWWIRVECAVLSNRQVRKVGDRFLVYQSREDRVIGEADPGFEPLPSDLEGIKKVEFAREHDLPLPYNWSEEANRAWDNGSALVYFERCKLFGKLD
jgi:hypothetical protein